MNISLSMIYACHFSAALVCYLCTRGCHWGCVPSLEAQRECPIHTSLKSMRPGTLIITTFSLQKHTDLFVGLLGVLFVATLYHTYIPRYILYSQNIQVSCVCVCCQPVCLWYFRLQGRAAWRSRLVADMSLNTLNTPKMPLFCVVESTW